MDIEKVKMIKEKIAKAEIDAAKAKGVIENIQKSWLAEYGTDDIREIEKKLRSLKEQIEAKDRRIEKLYNDLLNSYDWESL